jgi:hypothetical protein
MGEGLVTCGCGEPTSDYRGKQCQECYDWFCSESCIYKYCCPTRAKRQAKQRRAEKAKERAKAKAIEKKEKCKCVKCDYCKKKPVLIINAEALQ